MTIIKILLVGAAIVAFMVVAQDRHWPQKVGAVGACTAIAAPPEDPSGSWYSCKQGLINGFPNLETDHCARIGLVRHREIWQCDAPLGSLPGT
jgi:hypothetical protein